MARLKILNYPFFSRDLRESTETHNMTVTSQGHGVDNNDSFADVGNNSRQRHVTSGSKSSMFSYKLAESPKRFPTQDVNE